MNLIWNKNKSSITKVIVWTMCMMLVAGLSVGSVVDAAHKPISELENFVDTYTKEYIGESVSGAAVVIVKDGEIVVSKGYGVSNVENETEINPETTVFEYEDLSKLYTWVAVMQLVEEGTLDLNENIFTYLPESFAAKLEKKLQFETPITLTHLMNNTAGFEEVELDVSVYDGKYLTNTLEEALLKAMPMQMYEPGMIMTASSYSASLAAYVVESVTELTFSSYIEEHVLTPLTKGNISVSANFGNDATIIMNKAQGYFAQESTFEQVSSTFYNLYATSGINGTATDLAKLLMYMMSDETFAGMYETNYAVNELAKGQTLGLYEYPTADNVYYIEGSNMGYSGMVMAMPEEEFGVVVLTNTGYASEFLYGLLDGVIAQHNKEIQWDGDTLPSVDAIVETGYVGARRVQSNLLEIFGFFMNCPRFEKIDEQTISLAGEPYVQVAPYVFAYAGEDTSVIGKTIASHIYFGVDDNGDILKWSYGGSGATEYVNINIEEKDDNFLNLTFLTFFIAIFTAAFLFTYLMVVLILDIIKKQMNLRGIKGAFFGFSFVFIGLVMNLLWLILKMMTQVNMTASSFRFNIIGNIVLAILGVLALVNVGMKSKNIATFKPYKIVLSSFIIMCFVILVYFMFQWNFFLLI